MRCTIIGTIEQYSNSWTFTALYWGFSSTVTNAVFSSPPLVPLSLIHRSFKRSLRGPQRTSVVVPSFMMAWSSWEHPSAPRHTFLIASRTHFTLTFTHTTHQLQLVQSPASRLRLFLTCIQHQVPSHLFADSCLPTSTLSLTTGA
jgi:hypothetical protein